MPEEIDVSRRGISNAAKPQRAIGGIASAHRLVMLNIDAIEAINFEQLATVTDRLLLRGGAPKRRPSRPSCESTLQMRRPTDHWRRFTTTALLTALFAVSASIASLL